MTKRKDSIELMLTAQLAAWRLGHHARTYCRCVARKTKDKRQRERTCCLWLNIHGCDAEVAPLIWVTPQRGGRFIVDAFNGMNHSDADLNWYTRNLRSVDHKYYKNTALDAVSQIGLLLYSADKTPRHTDFIDDVCAVINKQMTTRLLTKEGSG